MSDIPKVERDGKVAVLVSPGFGAGWYTWNTDPEDGGLALLFCPEIVEALERGDGAGVAAARRLFPNAYLGGLDDLEVVWLPKGTAFQVTEYDGSESLEVRDSIEWITA